MSKADVLSYTSPFEAFNGCTYMSLSDLILPYQQLSAKNASRNKNNVSYRHQYTVVRYTNASIFVAEHLTMTEGTLKCVENILLLELLV